MALLSSIGGFIASMIGALVQWAGIFFAYRAGASRVKQKVAEQIAEVKDEQLEIAARAVEHRDDLLKRLRQSGL